MDFKNLIINFRKLLANDKKNESVMLEFGKQPNYSDKVKFIENLLIKYGLLPIKDVPLTIEKNNEKSIKLRQSGDECFAIKTPIKLYEALEFYNESIAYAELNTENLSLLYENRSDIYYELKMYEECLKNIELIKLNENQLQHSTMKKLKEYELICKNERQKQTKKKSKKLVYTPKLDYPPHEQIPFIANCLELCEDNKYGRYIKTNCDLEPGQIIAIEKPFSTILNPSKQYNFCANCLNENSLNLIPCLHCTSVMFCNDKCRNEAMNDLHKYECPIINYLLKTFPIAPLNALRLTLKAILAFKSTEKLIAFTQDNTTNTTADRNAFTINYNDVVSEEQKYYPIHALATNEDKRSINDSFYFAIAAASLYHYILKYTPFSEYLTTNDDQTIFVHLLYKHLMTATLNSHSIGFLDLSENLKNKITPQDNRDSIELSFTTSCYASATYALLSLMNHSCAHNIKHFTVNTDMVVYVAKSIKSGEQLFDNYRYHYSNEPKIKRQKDLSFQYHFQCECIACKYDYPLYDNIADNDIDKLTIQINKDINDYKNIASFNKKIALNCMEKCNKFLKKYSHHPDPSKLFYEIQQRVFTSNLILFDQICFRLQLYVNM